MSITNYSGLSIKICPTSEPAIYDFTVENGGDTTLWQIQIPTYDMLGPGDFGLDDTHMPRHLTNEESAHIPCLKAGASVTFSRKKWGTLEQYRGKASGSLYVTFSTQESSEARLDLRASFSVLGTHRDLQFTAESSLTRHPRAYRLGQAFRKLIGRLV